MMENRIVRPRKDLKLRRIGNQCMVVDACGRRLDLSRVYSLNAAAALMWERMAPAGATPQQLAEVLCGAYEVEPAVALRDVERQLAEWQAAGLLA